MRFHIDYYKPEEGRSTSKENEKENKRAVVKTILSKHDAVTDNRRYNAIFATASINDAIEYYELFEAEQQKLAEDENVDFKPINIACVFSPPAEGNKDVQQIQEDLPQEKEDNQKEPEE